MNTPLWSGKRLGACGLFVLTSALYIGGLSPTVAWRDSPEFVTVAHTLGISHPAGSPTYALLAKLTTFLPLGSIALRVNLFSALCAVLLVSMVFALLYELLTDTPQWTRLCAAWGGALFLCLSESFWRFAEVAEVYALQDYLLVIFILLLLKARTAQTSGQSAHAQWYWLFAFLYGMSGGVHATMALFAPAFLVFIWLTSPHMFRGKELALGMFFLVLGFSVCLYLPLRSLSDPAFNWGQPQTFQQFLIELLDRKDGPVYRVFSWAKFPYQIHIYLTNLCNEFSTLGVILGLLGCLRIFLKDKALGLLLGLVFLGNVAFFIRLWTLAFGFMPSFVIFALWIGFGIHACLTFLATLYQQHRVRIPRAVVHTILLGSIVATLSGLYMRHAAVADQAGNYSTELYGTHILEQLPPDAIFFSDYSWFPLLYLQNVERQRPDLTFLLQGEVLNPQYYTPLSRKRFPNILLSNSAEPMLISPGDYFWFLAKINAKEHPLFWDIESDLADIIDPYILPRGLIFAFDPWQQTEMTPEVLHTHWRLLSRAISNIMQEDHDGEAARVVASKVNLTGRYLQWRGFAVEAAHMYQTGLRIRPEDYYLRNDYGKWLMSQGQIQEALEQFNTAYYEYPILPITNRHLGVLLLGWGEHARAAYFLERALSFGEVDGDLYTLLAEVYSKLGQFPAAQRALQSALTFYEGKTKTPSDADDRLKTKIARIRENLHRFEQGLPERFVPWIQWEDAAKNGRAPH